MDASNSTEVALAYDVDVFAAMELPRFGGSQEVVPRKPPPTPRPQRLPRHVVDSRLDPFAADVSAGASDVVLAKRTDLRPGQVRTWRRRKKHPGVPGARKAVTSLGFMISPPVPSICASVAMHATVTGGRFKPPAYVLRQPLRYDAFADVVVTLVEAGRGRDYIALALGVTLRDVNHAYELGKRHPR